MQHATVATRRPQNTYGPPPASNGYGKVAEYPIQALVRVKAMASVESVENWRGSSPLWPWARSSSSSAERTAPASWTAGGCAEGDLREEWESLILATVCSSSILTGKRISRPGYFGCNGSRNRCRIDLWNRKNEVVLKGKEEGKRKCNDHICLRGPLDINHLYR
jgi:hypothetical protein